MKVSPKFNLTWAASKFQDYIFSWWQYHKRDLPWRRTYDPYKILVSEVMLQQTQVERVLPKYDEFLYFFPDVYTLARATPAKVLKLWRGMGYNRRALYLRKAAQKIIELHRGYFPENESDLVKLPGVGTYTARAILVFAYKKDIAMVDTNIRKIITHFFFNGIFQKENVILQVADKLLPKGRSWEWHQALMDYGSQVRGTNGKKQKPFKNSNRYFRGRVVDRLREGAITEKDLNVKPQIIESLIRDGLVVRGKDNMLRLPDAKT